MSFCIRLFMILSFLFANGNVMACEVCKKQQPKILQGVTHGAGPQSSWDYVAVWCMVLIVVISLFYCVKWMLSPGEKEGEHIKRSIFHPD
jgi:hypothetical protein